ncbi:DUF4097 family beta strand repeat-containing protein [Actinoplanes sichuanensis]|uniref:DUF4097 family beta strand repeat-containing protein n=1 Tax=Actinoplanes sichuanensis TaxID=512349 RepID=A0ABW4AP77_9ACTN|nr:DUF4097 family beta strand repeat-containing protein [Actinoplanes sichuanensis]BEL08440.1 DUF4097 family beta strand repeat-containing protein [Actinoplanes sichuanensis]
MQTFDTAGPITAILDIPAGRVAVTAADVTETTVEVRPADPTRKRDVRAAEQTTVGYADGVLRIEAATAKNQIFGNSGSVDVTVRVPAGSRVEGRAAAAEFRAAGRLGDLVFDTAQGPIVVEEAASARIEVAAGDVSLGRLTGPAEITVSKGDIRIAEAVRGSVVLRVRAGAIEIGAAAGVSAVLNAGVSYGRVDNRLKNDGTADLEIHATSDYGDIVAHSR